MSFNLSMLCILRVGVMRAHCLDLLPHGFSLISEGDYGGLYSPLYELIEWV